MINSQLKEAQASDRQLDFQNFNTMVRGVKELLATSYDREHFEVQNLGVARNIRLRQSLLEDDAIDAAFKCSMGTLPTLLRFRRPYWDRNNVWSIEYDPVNAIGDGTGDGQVNLSGITTGPGTFDVWVRARMILDGVYTDVRPEEQFRIRIDGHLYDDGNYLPTSEQGFANGIFDEYKYLAIATVVNTGTSESITGFTQLQYSGIQDHLAMPDSFMTRVAGNPKTLELNTDASSPGESFRKTWSLYKAHNYDMCPVNSGRIPVLLRKETPNNNPSYLRYFFPDTHFTNFEDMVLDDYRSIELRSVPDESTSAQMQIRGWHDCSLHDTNSATDYLLVRHVNSGTVDMSYLLIDDFVSQIATIFIGSGYGFIGSIGSLISHHVLQDTAGPYDDHNGGQMKYLNLGAGPNNQWSRNTRDNPSGSIEYGSVMIGGDCAIENDLGVYNDLYVYNNASITGTCSADWFDSENGYMVGGVQVVGSQQPSISDAGSIPVPIVVLAGSNTIDKSDLDTILTGIAGTLSSNATALNLILSALRTHGLIDT